MSKDPLREVCQNGTIPMLDSSVADVGQRASASQAACRVGLAKRGFAITSIVSTCRESSFRGLYRADAGREYDQKRAVFFEKVDERGGRTRKNFNDDECWVARTRCKIDEYEKLISCHYAAIRSVAYSCRKKGEASFCLSYVFNPTPNDTNLEPLRERRKRGKRNMPQR